MDMNMNMNEQGREPKIPLIDSPPEAPMMGPNLYLKNINSVFATEWSDRFTKAYIVCLFLQYACFFVGLPFEDISNRPGFCIVADFYLIITVITCITLLPLGAYRIPDRKAYFANLLATLLQFSCIFMELLSVYAIFSATDPFNVKNGKEVTDMHRFSKAAALATLGITVLTFSMAVASAIVQRNGLYHLLNRIHRRKFDPGSFGDDCPSFQGDQPIMNKQSDDKVLVYPPEVVKLVRSTFLQSD